MKFTEASHSIQENITENLLKDSLYTYVYDENIKAKNVFIPISNHYTNLFKEYKFPLNGLKFYPFINKERTLKDIENLNFFDISNKDFFITDENNFNNASFVSHLWIDCVSEYLYCYGYLNKAGSLNPDVNSLNDNLFDMVNTYNFFVMKLYEENKSVVYQNTNKDFKYLNKILDNYRDSFDFSSALNELNTLFTFYKNLNKVKAYFVPKDKKQQDLKCAVYHINQNMFYKDANGQIATNILMKEPEDIAFLNKLNLWDDDFNQNIDNIFHTISLLVDVAKNELEVLRIDKINEFLDTIVHIDLKQANAIKDILDKIRRWQNNQDTPSFNFDNGYLALYSANVLINEVLKKLQLDFNNNKTIFLSTLKAYNFKKTIIENTCNKYNNLGLKYLKENDYNNLEKLLSYSYNNEYFSYTNIKIKNLEQPVYIFVDKNTFIKILNRLQLQYLSYLQDIDTSNDYSLAQNIQALNFEDTSNVKKFQTEWALDNLELKNTLKNIYTKKDLNNDYDSILSEQRMKYPTKINFESVFNDVSSIWWENYSDKDWFTKNNLFLINRIDCQWSMQDVYNIYNGEKIPKISNVFKFIPVNIQNKEQVLEHYTKWQKYIKECTMGEEVSDYYDDYYDYTSNVLLCLGSAFKHNEKVLDKKYQYQDNNSYEKALSKTTDIKQEQQTNTKIRR